MATITSVGVPREIKTAEGRVALTPDGVRELARHDIKVVVQSGAGDGASIPDAEYVSAGAQIAPTAGDAWSQDLVVKVKEPKESEFGYLRPSLTLFTYLHLAAYPAVADALINSGTTSIAYETVQGPSGSLPLLAPMSEIAGRLAAQVGAQFLERPHGGRGILLGGAPGVRPARVAVVGAGNVGWNAACVAAGMDAEVTILDKNIERLRTLESVLRGRMVTLTSNHGSIERTVAESDLVIGAVLVPGGKAPVVVTDEMIASMRPGSVVVDVAVDQGGCIETTHETTHADPVYVHSGVVHYAVGNMPGAVPFTSTYALTNATLPYLMTLVREGVRDAVLGRPDIAHGLMTHAGRLTCEPVAEALGRDFTDVSTALHA